MTFSVHEYDYEHDYEFDYDYDNEHEHEKDGCAMRYRKIHIIGPAGSGKSYLAQILSERYGIPSHDLDLLFWDNKAGGYGVMADPEARDDALEEIVNTDAWIAEGSYCRWPVRSFEEADIILVLKVPAWVRDWRILARFIKRKLRLIPSRKKETLRALVRLLRWNHGYYRRHLPLAMLWIKSFEKPCAECTSIEDAIRVLEPKFDGSDPVGAVEDKGRK